MHLCACVSKEGGGEGAGSEAPSLLSYTRRYVSFAEFGHVICQASGSRSTGGVDERKTDSLHL
jgi:hypothetical protein